MLESQAENTKTYDENGFDRLKNGYVVDDFTDHTTGDILHPDYKCSLDFREGQLRPQHYTTNIGLQYNAADSTNIVKTEGNVLMLPYEDVALITQPYASRTENVNPFNVFTFIGRIDLTPASDDWIDINVFLLVLKILKETSQVFLKILVLIKMVCTCSMGFLAD